MQNNISLETSLTDQGADELWLDDFAQDDLVYFKDDLGFAINLQKQRLIVFQMVGDAWFETEHSLGILRGASDVVPTRASHFALSTKGSAHAIGQSIGVAVADAVDKGRVRRGTGVELKLRLVEHPTLFINITNDSERASLMEALRQALSDGSMATPFRIIPMEVEDAYTPLTDAEIAEQDRLEAEHEWKAEKTSLRSADFGRAILAGLAGIVVIRLVIRQHLLSTGEIQVPFFFVDGLVYFIISFLAALAGIVVVRHVSFWVSETQRNITDFPGSTSDAAHKPD